MFSYRSLAFFGFAICIAAILFAVLYLENTLYLDPCPLCILDRVVIIALGVIFSLPGCMDQEQSLLRSMACCAYY